MPSQTTASDYSFRPNGTLPTQTSESTDSNESRVDFEKAQSQKQDMTRIPAAAEFCKTALSLIEHNETFYDIQTLNQRLRQRGLELSKEASELFSENSALFSANPTLPTTPVGKFMYALRKAGMVDGISWEQPDYEAASNMLNDLRQQDPDNAAPLLFQLMIETRKGTALEELSDLVRDIVNARRFDTFYSGVMREFRDAAISWQDPTAFMLANHVLSSMPVPGYNALPALVNQLSENVPELREHLSEIMTQPGREATESFNSYGYNVLDYSYGRSFSDREIPRFNEIDQVKAQPPLQPEDLTFDTALCSDQTYQDFLSKMAILKSSRAGN